MDNLVSIYYGGTVERDRYGYVELVDMQSVPVLFNERPSFSELTARAREEVHSRTDDGIIVDGVLHFGYPPNMLRKMIPIGCADQWDNYVRSAMKSQFQSLDVVVQRVLVDPIPLGLSPPMGEHACFEPPVLERDVDAEVPPMVPDAQSAPYDVAHPPQEIPLTQNHPRDVPDNEGAPADDCLTDWDQAGQYSWGSAVLAFLYRQLCEACRRSSASASLGGCAYLLQLWMWSRLPVARPVMLAPRDWFPVHNARLQPTWAYLWDQVTVPHARMERAYKEYTDELDRLMASSVTWDPYADEAALPFVVSNICDSDSDLYRVRCPLICFYAVEYHLPHRVARQFGARQRSPPSPISTSVDLHKLDRKKNRKIFDWAHHHRDFIDMWNLFDGNVDTNNEAHTNIDYRRYQAWYHQATRPRLRLQWTQDDYADIESSEDEDTAYDTSTRTGRQVGAGPILDRVGNSLKMSVQEIERFRPRVRDDETRSFLDRLARRLRRTAARCGCRTGTTEDVYVPSAPRGGVGSSSHPPTGSRNHGTEEDDDEDDDDDDEDEDEDQGHEEIGPSQLDDAPWTQPTQPVGTRRRRPPDPYTPGTHALGHKGKGKSRRQ